MNLASFAVLAAAVLLGGCAGSGRPIAFDDEITAAPGAAVEIPVLDNDTDPDGDPLVLMKVGPADQGKTRISPRNTIQYTADPDARGQDSFTYRIADNNGRTTEAKVRVIIGDVPPAARLAPGEEILDALIVTLHTGDDDKDRAESVRLAVRRDDRVLSDELVGVGQRWGAGTSREFVVDLDPDVLVDELDRVTVGVQKIPSGPGGGSAWLVAPEIRGRLSNGRIITLLPRGEMVKMGDGEPYDRAWPLSRAYASPSPERP